MRRPTSLGTFPSRDICPAPAYRGRSRLAKIAAVRSAPQKNCWVSFRNGTRFYLSLSAPSTRKIRGYMRDEIELGSLGKHYRSRLPHAACLENSCQSGLDTPRHPPKPTSPPTPPSTGAHLSIRYSPQHSGRPFKPTSRAESHDHAQFRPIFRPSNTLPSEWRKKASKTTRVWTVLFSL